MGNERGRGPTARRIRAQLRAAGPLRLSRMALRTAPARAVSWRALAVCILAASSLAASSLAASTIAATARPVRAADAAASVPDAAERAHARVHLWSETGHLVRGDVNWLALHFEIDPGWHLYWNGRNDSGYPPSLELDLPPGWEVGPIAWPAPERHLSPGDILDHIYSREVALLVPLRVPAGPAEGSSITLRGRADWLACRSVCVPEGDSVRLRLPVAAGRAGSSPSGVSLGLDAPLPPHIKEIFDRARARLPRPIEEARTKVSLAWKGETLRVKVAGARGLSFFPSDDCSPLARPIQDTTSEGGTLHLRFEPEIGGAPLARGVLEVRGTGIDPRWYSLDARPDANAAILDR